MAGLPTSYPVEVLAEDDWPRLREIRLAALQDEPAAFLATHEREAAYDEQRWREEFARGEWNVMLAGDKDIGLLGVTREAGMPARECYLEYLWVAPGSRRAGMASLLLRTVLDRHRDSGVRTVWLWIMDGNELAMHLYQNFGFQSTHERQPLPDDPRRSEERMMLQLS